MEPFLKWAGGKRWLLSAAAFPRAPVFERFVEPFIGGGAVYFYYRPSKAIISDVNAELVQLYRAMKGNPQELERIMQRHHQAHSDEYYYRVRAETPESLLEAAGRTLYLNRTCWNGLYRVNLAGQFNVPRGTKNTVIFEGEDFVAFSKALSGAEIRVSDFETVMEETRAGDLLFLDPPYTVRHNMNGFIKYNEKLFRWEDQIRLKEAVVRAKERGVSIIMTNADHESVRELYSGVLDYEKLSRTSVLAGTVEARVGTSEALFTGGLRYTQPAVQSAGSLAAALSAE